MAITIPTVDEFTESTVMLVIREIAEYICGNNGLVAQINNNDITGFTSSYTNNILKIDATKGDGSTIPVCNVTIEGGSSTGNPYPTGVNGTVGSDGNITFNITMSSGSPLTTTINMNYFASTADLSDLQEQVTGIKPTVTTNLESSPPTITVSVNGTSSTANLPSASVSSNWEEIDLSNMPTDFAIGDEIEIVFKITTSANSLGGWTIKPTSINIISDPNILRITRIKLTSNMDYYFGINVATVIKDYAIIITAIDILYGVSKWNSQSNTLFTLKSSYFNGAGNATDSQDINRSNIKSYVYSMKRKKSNTMINKL